MQNVQREYEIKLKNLENERDEERELFDGELKEME